MNEESRLASLLENVDSNAKEYASTLTLEQMLCSKCTKPMTCLESLKIGVCLWCRPIKAGGKQPESAPTAEAKAGSLQQPGSAACNIYIEWNNYAIRCTGEATLEEMDGKIAEAYTALKKGFESETDGKIEMPPNK